MSSQHPPTVEEPVVSHGRGGAGNVLPDNTPYVDGEIVREGAAGDQGDGAYSAGRGGAGNIGSPGLKPSTKPKGDVDVIPEQALRPESDTTYHVGRGGDGNVHKQPSSTVHQGLADKLKHKFLGKKKDPAK